MTENTLNDIIFTFTLICRYKLWGQVFPPGGRQRLLLSGWVFRDLASGATADPRHPTHLWAEGEGHRSRPASSPLLRRHGDSGRGLPGRLPARLPEFGVHRSAARIPDGWVWGVECLGSDSRRWRAGSNLLPHRVQKRCWTVPAGLRHRSETILYPAFSHSTLSCLSQEFHNIIHFFTHWGLITHHWAILTHPLFGSMVHSARRTPLRKIVGELCVFWWLNCRIIASWGLKQEDLSLIPEDETCAPELASC